MLDQGVLRERNWTEAELVAAGFHYYSCRKRVVMARELPASEAPLTIRTAWDILIAGAGYWICFSAGDTVRQSLYEYPHWPVRPDHFQDLYRAWDDPDWHPSPAESHLMSLGCAPYYRKVGVWAKRLAAPQVVQTVESPDPAVVPAGAWLCIAAQGSAWTAPYSMSDEAFCSRYLSASDRSDDR